MPGKTNTPLVINPYAVLALAITTQRFQTVARGNQQIMQAGRRFQHVKTAQGDPGNRGKALVAASIEKFLRISAIPSLNHNYIILLYAYYGKRKIIIKINISFDKTGPNTVRLIVPATISKTQLLYLTRHYTDDRVDEAYNMPYPATLSFSGVIMYTPDEFFAFDRNDRIYDISPMAVGVTHEWR
jgi:hypothetical protein